MIEFQFYFTVKGRVYWWLPSNNLAEFIAGIGSYQVGIGVALKPHHTLSSLFRKPKDVINFEQKRGLVYQIS